METEEAKMFAQKQAEKRKKFYDEIEKRNEQPAEVMQFCIDQWIIPYSKNILLHNDNVEQITVAIAQYWNDEADDAIHIKFFPSSQKNLSWNQIFKKKFNSFSYNEDHGYINDYSIDTINADKLFNVYLDNNETFIKTFSSFCKEGCNQEMSHFEAYTPLIYLIRELNGEISIKNLIPLIKIFR